MTSARGSKDGLTRALLDLGLTVAVPLSTQLARLTGEGRPEEERARESEGPLTPASGAFAIWVPIFASLAAYGVERVRHRDERASRAEALTRASLLGNVLWNVNAQYHGFGWPSVALIGGSAATATAAVAAFEADNRSELARTARFTIAPLAGWLSVATFANVATTLRYTGSSPRNGLILGLATATTIGGAIATRGNLGYAGAAAWGLGGIAIKNARAKPGLAAAATVAGVAVVAASVLLSRMRRFARATWWEAPGVPDRA